MINQLLPVRLRVAIRSMFRRYRYDRKLFWAILKNVRLRSLVEVFACLEDGGGEGNSTFNIWLRNRQAPFLLRRGSSDFYVFRQVVLEDQYKLEDVDAPKYIVDAGANIGLTSALLLERFPDCSVLSIEPDPQNYSIASQNLKGYGDRCRLLRVALWSKEETLSVQRGTYRDGLDWASQTVSTNDPNSATVSARTLNSLLSEVGFPRIDLLKIDIEGAELQVFGEGDTSFLEKTSYCATECHDDQCLKAFVDATKRYGFSIRHEGELAIAWHPSGQPRRDHS